MDVGAVEVHSHLFQPLQARMTVSAAKGRELRVHLASREDFARAGLLRTPALEGLRFRVTSDRRGRSVVVITSRRPIVEPVLSLVLTLEGSRDRRTQVLDLLLDPPDADSPGTRIAASRPQASPVALSKTPSTPESRPAPIMPAKAAPPPSPAPAADSDATLGAKTEPKPEPEEPHFDDHIYTVVYGPTGSNESLTEIAYRVRPDKRYSLAQTMMALFRANPEAFAADNINGLRPGHNLRLGDPDTIGAMGKIEAAQAVARHNKLWQRHRAARQQAAAEATGAER